MSWWWCCCRRRGPCEECFDTFGRTDSTDIGSATCFVQASRSWNEPAGDWSILNEQLVEAGNAGAVAVILPLLGPGGFVNFEGWPEIGDKYRAVLNYLDIDNYHFVEWEWEEPVPGTYRIWLRLWQRKEGGNTLLLERYTTEAGWQPEESYYFSACITEYWFMAWGIPIEGAMIWTCNAELIPGGYGVGVGNGANSPITVDGFWYVESWSKRRDCPECACTCEHHCVPGILQGTFEVISGTCPNLDGLTFDLVWNRTAQRWLSVGGGGICTADEVRLCFYNGFDVCQEIGLVCDGVASGPDHWLLVADFPTVDGLGANANSTCDPLYLEWIILFGQDPNWAQGCDPDQDCDGEAVVRLMITEKP